jgi:hypothetical protein
LRLHAVQLALLLGDDIDLHQVPIVQFVDFLVESVYDALECAGVQLLAPLLCACVENTQMNYL